MTHSIEKKKIIRRNIYRYDFNTNTDLTFIYYGSLDSLDIYQCKIILLVLFYDLS